MLAVYLYRPDNAERNGNIQICIIILQFLAYLITSTMRDILIISKRL